MRALLRVLFSLVVLGALVGCVDAGTEARKKDCYNWVNDDRGGHCDRPFSDLYDDPDQDRTDYENQKAYEERYEGSGSASTSNTGIYDQPRTYEQNYLDCEDFNSRAEAQAYLDEHPWDPHYLDGDEDGIACEWGT